MIDNNTTGEGRHSRTEALIGKEALSKLNSARVAVFGLGGVGGYVVEALARAGIGSLLLIDGDRIAESNINRQIIADTTTVGKFKADAFSDRIALIDPSIHVTAINEFITPESLLSLNLGEWDYVVDAIDTVSVKIALAKLCFEQSLPIISSMGTGNKLDPTAFLVSDIYKTSVCPLARVMRQELRRLEVPRLKVLYSKEEPKKADTGMRSPASISFVPAAAGLIIAGEVIKDICGINEKI